MDERTMFELLEIYDAKEELHQVLEMLAGMDCSIGYDDGVLGKLSRVTDIIKRHSPLHHTEEDYDESGFWKILEDETIDNHQKAGRLLG